MISVDCLVTCASQPIKTKLKHSLHDSRSPLTLPMFLTWHDMSSYYKTQSLPDTGWPTYCSPSPPFLVYNPTHQIHHSVSWVPDSSSSTVLILFEWIRSESIICWGPTCCYRRPCFMARATIFYLQADRMGWKGGFGRRGGGWISCSETRNSKWRRLELWWPLSASDKLTVTPPGSLSLSLPLYLSVSLLWHPRRHCHTVLSFREPPPSLL